MVQAAVRPAVGGPAWERGRVARGSLPFLSFFTGSKVWVDQVWFVLLNWAPTFGWIKLSEVAFTNGYELIRAPLVDII